MLKQPADSQEAAQLSAPVGSALLDLRGIDIDQHERTVATVAPRFLTLRPLLSASMLVMA